MGKPLPILHELRVDAVLTGEPEQSLRAVLEVLAQDMVLGTLGPAEGEVEDAVPRHDPAGVGQTFLDDLEG